MYISDPRFELLVSGTLPSPGHRRLVNPILPSLQAPFQSPCSARGKVHVSEKPPLSLMISHHVKDSCKISSQEDRRAEEKDVS